MNSEPDVTGGEIHQLKVEPLLDEGLKTSSSPTEYLTQEYRSDGYLWMKVVEGRTQHTDTAQASVQFDIPGSLVMIEFAIHKQPCLSSTCQQQE